MKSIAKQITFDKLFKVFLLISLGYFLILFTNISRQLKENSDVGRFQFIDRHHVIDTKTGAISDQ